MAVTQNQYTGNSSTTNYSFTFPYLAQTDVGVKINGTTQATTTYSFANATTISMNSAPANGATVIIFRNTNNDAKKATFYPGSAIKAEDLNNDFDQILYTAQEIDNNALDTLGATSMQVDLDVGNNKLINVASPTASTDGTNKTYVDTTIDSKIDTALTTDVFGGQSITITDNSPASGQITASVTAGSIRGTELAGDAVDGTKIADDSIDSEHYVDGSIDRVHLSADVIDGTKIADNAVSAEHIAANSVGDSEIIAGALDNRYYRESELLTDGVLDNRYFTQTAADARYFNVSTGDTIKDGDAFPDNDTTIATTAAINDRIIDLVDEVGGFVPIANETSFPNANPDIDNGTGTLISIKALSQNLSSDGSGVATIANGTVGNSTVTITGLAANTTYAATFGMIVETSATPNSYTFHRQVPKATEVTTVASNISNVNTVASNIAAVNTVNSNISTINVVAANNTNVTNVGTNIANVNTVATNITDVSSFKDLYQIATSAPSTDGGGNSLAAGDMWFDSSSNKTLKVHNGTTFQSVSPTQAVLNDISIVSGQITYLEDLGSIADATQTGTGNNINTVASNISNVNTVAGVNANVTTVAGMAANVTTVAGIASNVTAVAGNASNINSAVSNASNINSAVSNASNINSAVSNASNINTVAGSIADVNRYATEYTISNSTPSSPSSGDLWYDGANNVLKFYNNSAFVGITPGLTDVINDPTPELGGHLDCNDKNLTEVGTVSGNNLQIDFGTLT